MFTINMADDWCIMEASPRASAQNVIQESIFKCKPD